MAERADEVSRRSAGQSGHEPDVVEARAREGRAHGEGEGAEQIRGEIEQTRVEMSQTIDAIQEKLAPERLTEQAKEQAKETVRGATVGQVKRLVSSASRAGQTARGTSSRLREAMQEMMKRNPLPTQLQSLAGMSFGSQPGKDGLPSRGRVVIQAAKRVWRRPSQSSRFGVGPGALAALGVGTLVALSGSGGVVWLSRRRQYERNRPLNRLRRTISEMGDAAGRVRGLSGVLALVILGLLLGWALRGRRLRTESDVTERVRTADTGDTGDTGNTGDTAERLELREEELQARRQPVEAGEVRVGKEVVEEQRTREVPVTYEEIELGKREVQDTEQV